MEQDNAWIGALQCGDNVILKRYGGADVLPVSRVTDSQVIIQDVGRVLRFRKTDGRQIGGSSLFRTWLYPYEESEAAAIETANQREVIYSTGRTWQRSTFATLTPDQCNDVFECLKRNGLLKAE